MVLSSIADSLEAIVRSIKALIVIGAMLAVSGFAFYLFLEL